MSWGHTGTSQHQEGPEFPPQPSDQVGGDWGHVSLWALGLLTSRGDIVPTASAL